MGQARHDSEAMAGRVIPDWIRDRHDSEAMAGHVIPDWIRDRHDTFGH